METKGKILIIEDEFIIAQDLKKNLERLGFTVLETVDTGEKALRSVELNRPDLTLVDIVLKGEMDGITLASQILKIHNIPIIYTTAYSDLKTRDRARITRPFGFLLKPYNYQEVHTAIEMALYRHSLDLKLREQEKRDKEYQEALRDLAAHLQSVREDERTRIAREIHDDLGQSLTALKMDLSWIQKRLSPDEEAISNKIRVMSGITNNLIDSVKKISTDLRPGLLDDLGLTAAMEWQSNEFNERTGIECSLTIDPEDYDVDEPLATPLFRIFQESLTNIARHAEATKVAVSLTGCKTRVELKVTDNGKGISQKEIQKPKSFGILGMRERTAHLGGQLNISASDNGTTVRVEIPLF